MRGRPRTRRDARRRSIDPAPEAAGSLHRRMASGAAWMVAARWSIRGIGLVSTIVLARLLAPADFGLVAMGMITVGFVRAFAESGQDLAVIRHPDATAEHFDTAWTMSVCVGFLVALVIFSVAPLGGWYFHSPRAVPLIRFLALAPLIEGFTNVGVVAGYRRSLQFDKDFYFRVFRKFSGFVVALPLAFLLRDYRALAAGIVFGRVITVFVSYRMHPYRPRFRLTKLRDIWSFSIWSQISALAQFFGTDADLLIVGGLAGVVQMGSYTVAADLGTAPVNAIVGPSGRALFPIYATLLDAPERLKQSLLDVLSFTAIVALSTGVGIALVAHDLVSVVLGAKWSIAAPLVPWLAIGGAAFVVAGSGSGVINATGNARLNALRNWAFVALLAPAMVVAGLYWSSEGVAAARMVVSILFVPIMFYSLTWAIPLAAGEIIERLWRPVLAALLMAAGVSLFATIGIASVPVRLFCNVGVGAAIFTTSLLTLWLLAGRPPGAERLLLAAAAGAVRRLLKTEGAADVEIGRSGPADD